VASCDNRHGHALKPSKVNCTKPPLPELLSLFSSVISSKPRIHVEAQFQHRVPGKRRKQIVVIRFLDEIVDDRRRPAHICSAGAALASPREAPTLPAMSRALGWRNVTGTGVYTADGLRAGPALIWDVAQRRFSSNISVASADAKVQKPNIGARGNALSRMRTLGISAHVDAGKVIFQVSSDNGSGLFYALSGLPELSIDILVCLVLASPLPLSLDSTFMDASQTVRSLIFYRLCVLMLASGCNLAFPCCAYLRCILWPALRFPLSSSRRL
jgi:hypothetical protein